MIAINKYTASYGRSLLAATPQDQLVEKPKSKVVSGRRQLLDESRDVDKSIRNDELLNHLWRTKRNALREVATER